MTRKRLRKRRSGSGSFLAGTRKGRWTRRSEGIGRSRFGDRKSSEGKRMRYGRKSDLTKKGKVYGICIIAEICRSNIHLPFWMDSMGVGMERRTDPKGNRKGLRNRKGDCGIFLRDGYGKGLISFGFGEGKKILERKVTWVYKVVQRHAKRIHSLALISNISAIPPSPVTMAQAMTQAMARA
ncbi:unnamed protein product [Cochlearia groenlandica]